MPAIFRKLYWLFAIVLLQGSMADVFSQKLQIPFYDDFSQPGLLQPDSRLWLPSGVTLNNSYAINPPTQFVATFDGRDARGLPYDGANASSSGTTDSLVSRPIDLSNLTPKDSLILSFFWQPKGLGDLPDPDDSLVVKFRNRKNEWITVWRNDKINPTNFFNQTLLTLKDTAYFHADFQFAFITKGRQSGPFDTWHVDYVYLEKNRSKSVDTYNDIAVQTISTPLLKNYRSMPLRQFLVNPAKELTDTLKAQVNNLRPANGIVRLKTKWNITDTLSKRVYLDRGLPDLQPFRGQSTSIFGLSELAITPKDSAVLSYGFKVFSADTQTVFVQGVDFTRNDSLYNYAVLKNYYAYDDGTAEVGADVDLRLGSVAVQFVLNQPDTLGAIRINFTPYFKNQTNTDFLLRVFSSKNGKPDREIAQRTIKIAYPKFINGFIEYDLDRSIAVKDTFYVGWSRLSEETIAIGFDKNSPQFANRIFYNLGREWQSNIGQTGVPRINGSFMVRPVMGFRKSRDGVEEKKPLAAEPISDTDIIIYPNPAQNIVRWKTVGEFEVSVISMAGREMIRQRTNQGFIDVDTLENGMYILRLKNAATVFSKKFIIQK